MFLIVLAFALGTGACAGGRGAPVFGTQDQAPTRTIAGERVELQQYGGAWVPVAEVPATDRATQDAVWSRLIGAGIPATSVSYGPMLRIKVPGPHVREARSVLRPLASSGVRIVER